MNEDVANVMISCIDIEAVPSLPAYVTQVSELLGREDVSTGDVAELIGQDVGLAARILKLANSVIYSRNPNETSSINEAVGRIGLGETKNVCLSVGMARQFDGSCKHVDLTELWKHSMAVAFASKSVYEFCRAGNCTDLSTEVLHTAGLMHDIGLVAVDRQQPEIYENVFEEQSANSGKFYELEKVLLGFTHADVGSGIVKEWGLPKQLGDIIKYHHEHEGAPPDIKPYAQILHVADCICNQNGFSDDIEGRIEPFDVSAWHDLGLDDNDIPTIVARTEERIKKAVMFAALAR